MAAALSAVAPVMAAVMATVTAQANTQANVPVTEPTKQEFTLVPEFSFVQFEVLHFGTSTTRGRFGPLQGLASLDRSTGRGEVSLRIATAGVSTGIAVFDARLRQRDLLNASEFPEAFFVARDFRFNDKTLQQVRGEFTFRGQSRPLSLRAIAFSCRIEAAGEPRDPAAAAASAQMQVPAGADAGSPGRPGGREICGGDFEGEVLRSDFGATFGLPFVADKVRLVVQVEAARALP